MPFPEILISIFFAVLFVTLALGLLPLKTPRKASLQGIQDPQAIEAYDRLSRTPMFRLIRRNFVTKLKKHVVEGAVLDVGCGPGYLLHTIAEEMPRTKLFGIDISKQMVERAKANFYSLGFGGRAEFKEGASDHLPIEDQTQDFVVSTLSLHHWVDPRSAFNEIHRVLKPGGQLLLLDLRRDTRWIVFWFLWFVQNVALRVIGLNAMARVNEPTGSLLASYTSQEIEEIMSETAFSDRKIEAKLGLVYLWAER